MSSKKLPYTLEALLVPLNAIIKCPRKRMSISQALRNEKIATVKKNYTYEVNASWCKERTTKVLFISANQLELLSRKRLEKYNISKDTNFKTSYKLYQEIKKEVLDYVTVNYERLKNENIC